MDKACEQFAAALGRRGIALPAGAAPQPPRVLIYFGQSPGDDLLCTAVLRELRRRGERDLWMMTRFSELFHGNADIDALVAPDPGVTEAVTECGGRLVVPVYSKHDWVNDAGDPPPAAHIIAVMCHLAGITGAIAVRPHLQLSAGEALFGRFAPRQIAIHSSGLGAALPMQNKEWVPQRFAEIVDALRGEFTFVQLGVASDPPLSGAIDLRGKTTLRQSAAVLQNSIVFVGLVGFLMHLARAVVCRSVIIYGGRELPWQSGYSCNQNLSNVPPCSPCWRWNRCDYERVCLTQITSAQVVDAVRQQAARAGEPIRDDVCEIDVSPG